MKKFIQEHFGLGIVFGMASIVLLSQCGGVNSVYYDSRSCLDGISSTSTGAQIYTASCSSCHGPVASSTKRGSTLDRLNNGIATVSQMSYLVCLTAAQRNAIITALNSRN